MFGDAPRGNLLIFVLDVDNGFFDKSKRTGQGHEQRALVKQMK